MSLLHAMPRKDQHGIRYHQSYALAKETEEIQHTN